MHKQNKHVVLSIGSSDLGGAQKIFINILEALIDSYNKISILIPKGDLVTFINDNYIHNRQYSQKCHLVVLPNSFLKKIFTIFFYLKKNSNTKIIISHLGNCSLWFSLACFFNNKKLICAFHNVISKQNTKTNSVFNFFKLIALKTAYKIIFCRSNKNVFCSNYLYEEFKKHFAIPNHKIIANGVNDEFDNRHQELLKSKFSTQMFSIGVIGRLSDEKGQIVFLKAINRLKNKIPLKGVLVGKGPDENMLRDFVEKNNLESIIDFYGHSNNIQALIAEKFHVVVVPSREEAFSLVTIESFSVSTAVIGANLGGIKDLIRNYETGILFTKNDDNDLAKKIEELYNDNNLLIRLGKSGRKEFLDKHQIQRMQQEWLMLIDSI